MKKEGLSVLLLVGILLLALAGCVTRSMRAPAPPEEVPPLPVEYGMEEAAPSLPVEYGMGENVQAVSFDATIERLVIRTADLELTVPDTEEALDRIQALVEELGGYVVSLDTYQYQEGVQAVVTFRVPAESFDVALDRVKEIATTVRRESISGQDVTEEYVDLEARLRHLQAKEAQLLEFLDQAEDTEAVMQVYAELSRTQQEIEVVRGRMQYLENRAALATITVNLTPDELAQPLEVGGWNLPGTVRNALELLLNVLEFTVKALIYLLVVGLPTVLVVAAPLVGLVFVARWLIRRSRKPRR
ncbi:MAG TPA: DUF4349 domain-containing protein [Anaerolineae bacterium]|nr:DUF4349 domain-containing protein [Anaerolineae bacterium]